MFTLEVVQFDLRGLTGEISTLSHQYIVFTVETVQIWFRTVCYVIPVDETSSRKLLFLGLVSETASRQRNLFR